MSRTFLVIFLPLLKQVFLHFMEGNSNSQVPDLASVLATLARLAPARSQQAQQQPIAVPQHHLGQPYRPPASQGYGFSEESPAMIAPRPIHSVDDGYDPAAIPQHRSPPSLIDPATITEWSQGLRCVSKIASDNPNFKVAIRKVYFPFPQMSLDQS